MSSSYYAFMFPGCTKTLRPSAAIRTLADAGLFFDKVVYPSFAVDSDGHLEQGDQEALTGLFLRELEERLDRDEQLLIECRNRDLVLALSTGTQYSNPYMTLAWSRRIFANMEPEKQEEYLRLIRRVAGRCGATYVTVVVDPPDYFEDRFLCIDGRRFLDKYRPSGAEYDFHAVWIAEDSSDEIPEGVRALPGTQVGEGFREYSVG